ncbi:MAG: PP2C family protein-serine/threonine phosphatase [Planctomycetota bacterium]|nr:PP2C family protein-serine/threonine phosphatase [Planctomycetota bacterium]
MLTAEPALPKARRLASAVAAAWPAEPSPEVTVASHASRDLPLVEHADAVLVDLGHQLPPGETILGLLTLGEMGLPAVLLGDDTEFRRMYPDHGLLHVDRGIDPHALAGILFGVTHRQDEVMDLLHETGRSRHEVQRLDRQLDRLQHELQGASRLQSQSLPEPIQPIEGGSVATLWKPAGEVSGDLANVVELEGGCTALLVADSIGHGVPAAMLSMNLQRTLTEAREGDDPSVLHSPARMLRRLNESLVRTAGDETRFATALYAVFDPRTGRLLVGAAGHPAPILVRSGGTLERLPVQGPLLGLFSGECYSETGWTLQPSDRVVFYTDGIEQASACVRSPIGSSADAVEDLVRTAATAGSPASFMDQIHTALDLENGRRTGEDVDDLTMVCLSVDATPAPIRRAA